MFNIYTHKVYNNTYLKLGNFLSKILTKKRVNRFDTKRLCQINGLQSILQYPQNKKPFPERLIYEHKNQGYSSWYTMFDRIDVVGWMKGSVMHISKSDFYPENNYDTFFIQRLKADTYYMNVGSDFIKFAKNLSIKNGCNGRVCLVSTNRKRPPHIFYRKKGFDCQDKEKIQILDNTIKNFTPKPNSSKKVPAPEGSDRWVLKMFLPLTNKKP